MSSFTNATTTNIDIDTMARAPFSTAAFAQLVRRLRHTNARYNQIALQFRCRTRPTHHAKRRAYRAGLCIDTTKARACPSRYISTHPPPVLDTSAPAAVHATTEVGEHGVHQGDAYMRGSARRNTSETATRRQRRRDGRQRVMLRLPLLKLHLNLSVEYPSGAGESQCNTAVPGAPRLSPKQLPEDECGMEEILLGSSSCTSSSTDGSDSLLTPFDVQVYSGLCITVPPRNLKRKLQDIEADAVVPHQPKRFLKEQWSESQRQ